MPKVHLNDLLIREMAVADRPTRSQWFFDDELTGFVLERRTSGGMTFYFRYRDAHKRIRLHRIGSLKETSIQQARLKSYEVKAMLLEGRDPKEIAPNRGRGITLQAFVDEYYVPYVSARKRNPQVDIGILKKHISPRFGRLQLNRITVENVNNFQQSLLDNGYAHATINRLLVLLSHIFNVSIRLKKLPSDSNPVKHIPRFADTQRERFLSKTELRALFEELTQNPNRPVCRLVLLLLYTGARKRELLDARWSEVDFEQRVLWIPAERSKSKRPRPIALSKEALRVLKALPREPDVPYLFFNPKTRKPPVSVFVAWCGIRERAGVSDLRMHDLRHSFASFLVNAGRSLYDVQRLLGHQDPKVTMRYAHLSPSKMVEASDFASEVILSALEERKLSQNDLRTNLAGD